MTETAVKRGPSTCACIPDPTALIAEFRRAGIITGTVKAFDAPEDIRNRWALDGMIRARQRGASIADILSGAAIPDRTPPAVKGAAAAKPPGLRTLAVISVLADELFAVAMERTTGRLNPQQIEDMKAAARGCGSADRGGVARAAGEVETAPCRAAEDRGNAGAFRDARRPGGDRGGADAGGTRPRRSRRARRRRAGPRRDGPGRRLSRQNQRRRPRDAPPTPGEPS